MISAAQRESTASAQHKPCCAACARGETCAARYHRDPRGEAERRIARLETQLAEQGADEDLAALRLLRDEMLDDLAAELVVRSGYDHYVVGFSGGKDSVACVLRLLNLGVPAQRIELWHQEIDGREGSALMDWPCTRDYVRRFAQAFGLELCFSWREGGFEREMLRLETRTAAVWYEIPRQGLAQTGGTRGPLGTRRRFPQTSPDLSVRWCSAMKIDVNNAALRGQERFHGKRVLMITGERAEESAHRARYAFFEPDKTDAREGRLRRLVDHCRLVHAWPEARVWEIIEQHRINPHPAYRLGWGRVSCAACIFGNKNQWASLRAVNPAQFRRVAAYEAEFGVTIKRSLSVVQEADRGVPYPSMRSADILAASSERFAEPIILPAGQWTLPAGAFGDANGPI